MNNDYHQWAFIPAQPLQLTTTGTLAGLSFSVKDLMGVENWPTTASTHATLPPVAASPVVVKLLEQGAVLQGKTHLHEIALGIVGVNPVAGHAKNPLDPSRITGGSSSGAAVTVALKEVDFAIGTDTGGSIRIPAALCGVIGYKPTYGLYSTEGVLPLSTTCDHVGTLARDFTVIGQVHEAITGQRPKTTTWQGKKVALWNVEHWVDHATWQQTLHAKQVLELQGASVELWDFPNVQSTYGTIVLAEAAAIHHASLNAGGEGFSPHTLSLLRQGENITAKDYLLALNQREQYMQHLADVFKQYHAILAPCVPCVAPKIGAETVALPEGDTPLRIAFLWLTCPWSMLGIPVVSIPMLHNGLSTGIQIMLPKNEDSALLSLAQQLQQGLQHVQ